MNNPYKPNCVVTIDEKSYLKKLLSIKMHLSQDPPVVGGVDTRTFLNRAIDSDRSKDDVNVFEEKFFFFNLNESLNGKTK